MKVLFVSLSPINASISVGNTFLNVFEGIPNVEFASIFTKSGFPDVRINKAFRITEKMIVKKLFSKNAVGEEIKERYQGEKGIENTAIRFAKKKRWSIFFGIQNFIWKLPFWKSKQLKQFLDDYQPDCIFSLLSDSKPLNSLLRYVCDYTKAPLFLYAWDDNYTLRGVGCSPFKIIGRLGSRKSMRKTVKYAKQLYVISQIQKNEYDKIFQRTCKVLTKSADFSEEPKPWQPQQYPLKLLYTGNLGLNRWRSLALLVNALKKINIKERKAELEIYTGDYCTLEMLQALHDGASSRVMGSVSAEQVQKLQKDADILVHAEGLDKKSAQAVRVSFSTKLVDYFKNATELAKQFDALNRKTVLHSQLLDGKEFDKHSQGSNWVAKEHLEFLLKERYPLKGWKGNWDKK